MYRFLILCMLLVHSGCGIASVAVEQARESDPGEINLSKTRAYDSARVATYDKIFVLSRTVQLNQQGMMGSGMVGMMGSGTAATGGASDELFSGRITLALTKAGFDVFERDDIERMASEEQLKIGTERVVIDLAKDIGADAVVTTVIQQGSVSKVGFFGVGKGFESGIVSTSIKVVDASSNRSIAIISSDYPEPRTATEAIEGLVPYILEAFGK